MYDDINFIDNTLTASSGSQIIDAIIRLKVALCESKNITFTYTVDPIEYISLSPYELSSLFANLLDNAIEAAEMSDNPKVNLCIYINKNMLGIEIVNTYSKVPQIVNDRLVTTKHEKLTHGFGTEIINDIVSKYNGEYTIDINNEYFVSSVVLTANVVTAR